MVLPGSGSAWACVWWACWVRANHGGSPTASAVGGVGVNALDIRACETWWPLGVLRSRASAWRGRVPAGMLPQVEQRRSGESWGQVVRSQLGWAQSWGQVVTRRRIGRWV